MRTCIRDTREVSFEAAWTSRPNDSDTVMISPGVFIVKTLSASACTIIEGARATDTTKSLV